jgi:WD40 repeat protein
MRQPHKTFLALFLLLSIYDICAAQTETYPLQRGDAKQISELSWSPGNDLILTSSGDDNDLRLWEVRSGKLRWKTDVGFLQDELESYSIRHSAWTNDQRLIVTGTYNGKLQLWDAANGKLIWNIAAHAGSVTAIAISPNSTTFVSSADLGNWNSELKVWNLADGKLIRNLSANRKNIQTVTFIDGNRFQTGNRFGQVTTWSASTFKVINTKQLSPCGAAVGDKIVYIPNHSPLALQCGAKPAIKGHPQFDEGVLNRDGSLVAALPSYRADGVEIFDTRTGQRRSWLVGHPGIIKSLAFSADGRMFFSGSADRVVRVWNTQSRNVLFSLEGHTDAVESLEPGNDGRTLISRSKNEGIIWDVQRGVKLTSIAKEQRFEEQNQQTLSPIRQAIFIDQLDNIVFCPDEKHFLAKPWWSGWQLWSIDGNKPIREFDVGYSFYNRVAFHPNGRIFVTGGEGQNIFMFDLETGNKIWSLFEIDQQEFESKKAAEARRVAHIAREKEQARLADLENQAYANQVYIKFDHYGDMTPLGQQSAGNATAIWLRLHNDSPLPVSVPTQSMYLPNPKCFHQFSSGEKILGLCDNREIGVWLGLEDKDGQPLPFGFDFGSSAILLPGNSVFFAVPIDVLRDGRAIRFGVKFQKPNAGKRVTDYGNERLLRFRESDLPNN